MGSRAVLAFVVVGLLAGCSSNTAEPAPPPPTSRVPTVDVPLSKGIAVTAEQLATTNPCVLLAPGTLSTPDDKNSSYTSCFDLLAGSSLMLQLDFDFAFSGADFTPRVRNGVTVYGDTGDDNWCRRGIAVAEHAVISLGIGGDAPAVTCPAADRVMDGMLPKLIQGDLPADGLPKKSLANLDACALLKPAEVFRVRGIDKTQVTPGFDGQVCTWGNPTIDKPNVFIDFSPEPIEEADAEGDRTVTIDGRTSVVHSEPGSSAYGTLPSCVVRITHRSAGLDTPESVSLSVSTDKSGKDTCALATELATAAARRLPD